jgi:hypothetical protein
MNTNTATRDELIGWIVNNTSPDDLEKWSERWLKRYTADDLRDMVREVKEFGEVRGDYDGD